MGKHKSKCGLQGGSTVLQYIRLQKSSYITKYGMDLREVPPFPSPPPHAYGSNTFQGVLLSRAGIPCNCFVADTKGPDAPAPGRGGAGAAELPQQGASAASLSSAYVRRDRFCVYDVCAMYNQKEGNGWGPPGTSFPVYASSRASIETFQGIAKKDGTKIFGRKSV